MTDKPPGRDESPAVTTLAIQVSRLRRELGAMATTQRRHGVVILDADELKQEVERILAILDTKREASPAVWFWLTRTDEEREANSEGCTTGSKPSCASNTPTT